MIARSSRHASDPRRSSKAEGASLSCQWPGRAPHKFSKLLYGDPLKGDQLAVVVQTNARRVNVDRFVAKQPVRGNRP
jgi:hypothetical protein